MGWTSSGSKDDPSEQPSIILLGARGTGKSSLALIARKSLGLRAIDIDTVFEQRTGLTRSEYKKSTNIAQCREADISTLTETVETHARGCVIVCPAHYAEDIFLKLFKQYAENHPIIHIVRSLKAIQRYLAPWDPVKVARIIELSNRMYRASSNFEFYNIDESEILASPAAVAKGFSELRSNLTPSRPQSLLLKRTEESFVRFVRNVWRGRPSDDQQYGRFNFTSFHAVYTYLVSVPLQQIHGKGFNGEWLDCGADACQLEINLQAKQSEAKISQLIEDISRAYGVLAQFFPGSVIYHVALPSHLSDIEDNYFALICHGLRLGAQYMTIDLRWPSEKIERMAISSKFTKFIGCYHDDDPGVDGWNMDDRWNIYRKAQSLRMAGVRLTQVATNLDDNAAAAAFAMEVKRKEKGPMFLINYNTGPLGRPSLCRNRVLTPVTTTKLRQSALEIEHKATRKIEFTIDELQHALYATFVYDPMKYYIVGVDVSYSLSPIIHNAAHKFFGMPHKCSRRSTSTLETVRELVDDSNFGGMSIAQGFKRSIFPLLSSVSIHARNIGAVNTVLAVRNTFDHSQPPPADFWAARNRAGPVLGLYGDNLDWVGMMKCILRSLSPANVITPSTAALVIGAGGMARAALYALLQLNVANIVMYNRTVSNAEILVKHFSNVEIVKDSVQCLHGVGNSSRDSSPPRTRQFSILKSLEADWPSNMSQPTIVICCVPTPTGVGQSGADITLPPQWMRSPTGGVVVDLNYRQLVTPLIRQIRGCSSRGWVPVDGIQNLCAQSSAQFELFTSRRVPETMMRIAALEEYLKSHEHDAEAGEIIHCQLTQLRA